MPTTGEVTDVDGSDQPATSNSAAVSNSSSPGLQICKECVECPAAVYCDSCKTTLCARCDSDVVHVLKAIKNHKRMPVVAYLIIKRSLGDSSTDKIDAQMDIDEGNKLFFFSPVDNSIYLRPRLASLVENPDSRPSLVSFIGPSGGGKSTLVQILMRLDGTIDPKHMPIAGAKDDSHSTSADIHIYGGSEVPNYSRAQSGGNSKYPLLYLDSEGTGGSAEPRGIKRLPFTPEGLNNRLKHVMSSYPRMLYIFSDVLCFVFSGDWREKASIVGPLIGWGTSAAFGAANQRRPQLIIIFNKTGPDAVDGKFDDFRKTYEEWSNGDKDGSGKLLQYYSDPLVVRLPRADHSSCAVFHRAKLLYDVIRLSVKKVRECREQSHQLFTRCQLQHYMQLAADTFGNKSDAVFDIHATMARRPAPPDFQCASSSFSEGLTCA